MCYSWRGLGGPAASVGGGSTSCWESGSLPELKLVVENNRYSYSTPSRRSPAAFQPAAFSHLTLGGNSPFALSVPPRPLAAKLLNLEARNYLLFKSTLGNL